MTLTKRQELLTVDDVPEPYLEHGMASVLTVRSNGTEAREYTARLNDYGYVVALGERQRTFERDGWRVVACVGGQDG